MQNKISQVLQYLVKSYPIFSGRRINRIFLVLGVLIIAGASRLRASLIFHLKSQSFRRLDDPERISLILLRAAFNLIRVFLQKLVQHVRIERGRFEPVPRIVLASREILDHPLIIALKGKLCLTMQWAWCSSDRLVEYPEAFSLRLEQLGRVCLCLCEVSRAALRAPQGQRQQEQADRSFRRHLQRIREAFVFTTNPSSFTTSFGDASPFLGERRKGIRFFSFLH